MPTRRPYYRKRRPAPTPGPVTRFSVSGVRPDQIFPIVDTVHWRDGNITSQNAHLVAEVIEQAHARGLSLSDPQQAKEAICAAFLSHTIRST